MTGPISGGVAACAMSTAGAITICGSVLGMPYETLMIGSFASALVTIHSGAIDNKRNAAIAVILSTAAAGLAGAVGAPYIAHTITALADQSRTLQNLIAFGVGLIAPFVIPLLPGVIKRRSETI